MDGKFRLGMAFGIFGIAVAFLAVVPSLAGGAYALVGFPIYGAVCNKVPELFGGTARSRDYLVFLMNRGCDEEMAVGSIATQCFEDGAAEFVGRYRGSASSLSREDEAGLSSISRELETFQWPGALPSCGGGGELSNTARDFSRGASAGADWLISVTRQGTVFGAALFLAYAAAAALLGKLLVRLLFERN